MFFGIHFYIDTKRGFTVQVHLLFVDMVILNVYCELYLRYPKADIDLGK